MLEMDLRSGYAPVTVSFPSSSATTETAQPPGLALASFGSSVPSRVHCSSLLLPQVCFEPPVDESQSRPAPCVFGSVRGAGAARVGGGGFCSRRPEDEVVASGATAGGLPATRVPRVTATTQH